jgi:hypothetical protein
MSESAPSSLPYTIIATDRARALRRALKRIRGHKGEKSIKVNQNKKKK